MSRNQTRQGFAYLVQRTGDGIASGLVANGGVALGRGQAGKESDEGGLGEHGGEEGIRRLRRGAGGG